MNGVPDLDQVERLAALMERYGFATIVAVILLLFVLMLSFYIVVRLRKDLSEFKESVSANLSKLGESNAIALSKLESTVASIKADITSVKDDMARSRGELLKLAQVQSSAAKAAAYAATLGSGARGSPVERLSPSVPSQQPENGP